MVVLADCANESHISVLVEDFHKTNNQYALNDGTLRLDCYLSYNPVRRMTRRTKFWDIGSNPGINWYPEATLCSKSASRANKMILDFRGTVDLINPATLEKRSGLVTEKISIPLTPHEPRPTTVTVTFSTELQEQAGSNLKFSINVTKYINNVSVLDSKRNCQLEDVDIGDYDTSDDEVDEDEPNGPQ